MADKIDKALPNVDPEVKLPEEEKIRKRLPKAPIMDPKIIKKT